MSSLEGGSSMVLDRQGIGMGSVLWTEQGPVFQEQEFRFREGPAGRYRSLASVSSTSTEPIGRVLTTFAERGKGHGSDSQPALGTESQCTCPTPTPTLLYAEPMVPKIPLLYVHFFALIILPRHHCSRYKQYRMWNTLSHSMYSCNLPRCLQLPQKIHVVVDPRHTGGSQQHRRRGSIFRSVKPWGKLDKDGCSYSVLPAQRIPWDLVYTVRSL